MNEQHQNGRPYPKGEECIDDRKLDGRRGCSGHHQTSIRTNRPPRQEVGKVKKEVPGEGGVIYQDSYHLGQTSSIRPSILIHGL